MDLTLNGITKTPICAPGETEAQGQVHTVLCASHHP